MRMLLNLGAMFFFLGFVSTVCADKSLDIERILLHSPEEAVSLGEVVRGVTNIRVRSALSQAQTYQDAGDIEMRNRMLSLSLSLLEMEEFEKFSVSENTKAPHSASSSSRQSRFQSLYGENGLLGEENRNVVDQAVDVVIDSEKWFISMLEKLGVLSRDYKELNDKLRVQYPNLSREELADHLIKQSARLTAGVGFASALPGVIPGVGTAAKMVVSVGSMIPDMIYLFKTQATLIFRIAEIYGKDLKEDERITEALILFGVASGVSAATKALERYLEAGVTVYINSKITEEVVARGVTQLGTLHPLLADILKTLFSEKFITEAAVQDVALSVIPLIGAGISGATNYVFTRKVGHIAKVFYGDDSTDKLEAVNSLRLPKVELAMFRALVLTIMADGVKNEAEVLALNNFLKKFPHNRALVEGMLNGDQELLDKCDYDITNESAAVKEQILYAIIVMQYIDGEKGPEEIEQHDKIVEKFAISEEIARRIEIQVRKDRNFESNGVTSFVGKAYRGYQKMIGAREEVDF